MISHLNQGSNTSIINSTYNAPLENPDLLDFSSDRNVARIAMMAALQGFLRDRIFNGVRW